jgi:hypothetical protein
LKWAKERDSHHNISSKEYFLRIFTEILLDPAYTVVIIILAFSFFAPAFLFLLPSLRKKAGVLFADSADSGGHRPYQRAICLLG